MAISGSCDADVLDGFGMDPGHSISERTAPAARLYAVVVKLSDKRGQARINGTWVENPNWRQTTVSERDVYRQLKSEPGQV